MIERCQQLGLALEARRAVRVSSERVRQRFDGDLALQSRVARTKDLAHATSTKRGEDFVRAKSGTGDERHGVDAGRL